VSYREWDPGVAPPRFWTVRIPVTGADFIEFARETGCTVMPLAVVPVADLLSGFLVRLAGGKKVSAARAGGD
jgi:hypothetical protein